MQKSQPMCAQNLTVFLINTIGAARIVTHRRGHWSGLEMRNEKCCYEPLTLLLYCCLIFWRPC